MQVNSKAPICSQTDNPNFRQAQRQKGKSLRYNKPPEKLCPFMQQMSQKALFQAAQTPYKVLPPTSAQTVSRTEYERIRRYTIAEIIDEGKAIFVHETHDQVARFLRIGATVYATFY